MPVLIQNYPRFNPDTPIAGGQPPVIGAVGSAYDATILYPTANPVAGLAAGTGSAVGPAVVGANTMPAGMTSLVLDEQFVNPTLDSRWYQFDEAWGTGSTQNRVQRFRPENIVISAATSGGTGQSAKCISKRESFGGQPFTAGMFASKEAGVFYPVFGYYEVRMKQPHGQGVWPAFWLRHRDGASVCEVDIMEYFHTQLPGKFMMTLHRTNNAGTPQTNVNKTFGGVFFEAPTLTPSFFNFGVSILPEGANVRFRGFLGGTGGGVGATEVWNYLDTSAVYWSNTRGLAHPSGNGGAEVFDITVQGAQIGGNWNGHPDDPKGYSRWNDSCLSGGTKPNACNFTVGGYPIWTDAADYSGTLFPNTTEIDYVKVWSAL